MAHVWRAIIRLTRTSRKVVYFISPLHMVGIHEQCKIIMVLYTKTFLFFGTLALYTWSKTFGSKALQHTKNCCASRLPPYFYVSWSQQDVWLKNFAIFVSFRLTVCHLVGNAQFVVWGQFSPVLFNISNVVYWQVAEIFAFRPSLSSICCILYAPHSPCVHAHTNTHTHICM